MRPGDVGKHLFLHPVGAAGDENLLSCTPGIYDGIVPGLTGDGEDAVDPWIAGDAHVLHADLRQQEAGLFVLDHDGAVAVAHDLAEQETVPLEVVGVRLEMDGHDIGVHPAAPQGVQQDGPEIRDGKDRLSRPHGVQETAHAPGGVQREIEDPVHLGVVLHRLIDRGGEYGQQDLTVREALPRRLALRHSHPCRDAPAATRALAELRASRTRYIVADIRPINSERP